MHFENYDPHRLPERPLPRHLHLSESTLFELERAGYIPVHVQDIRMMNIKQKIDSMVLTSGKFDAVDYIKRYAGRAIADQIEKEKLVYGYKPYAEEASPYITYSFDFFGLRGEAIPDYLWHRLRKTLVSREK